MKGDGTQGAKGWYCRSGKGRAGASLAFPCLSRTEYIMDGGNV